MIVAGGIVTQKPIGIISNNPNFAQQQAAAQQREAAKQAQVDALAANLAAQHQAKQAQQAQQAQQMQQVDQPKKWSVPFK
jgi:hypothetical protein